LVFAHLFVKLPRPGDYNGTFSVFESSCHVSYYQSNHSEVWAILLSALPKDTTSELASYLHAITLVLNVKQRTVNTGTNVLSFLV